MQIDRAALTVLFMILQPTLSIGQESLEQRVRDLEDRVEALEEALAELSQPPSGEDVTAPVPMDGQAIAISLLQKTFHDGTYQDQIQFEFRFTNNLEKTVRAFTGVVVFQDLFDRDIMRVNVTVEDPVNPSGTVTWSGGIDYNQFIDTHQRLRSIAQRDLQTKFELTSVIFADGTRRRFDN